MMEECTQSTLLPDKIAGGLKMRVRGSTSRLLVLVLKCAAAEERRGDVEVEHELGLEVCIVENMEPSRKR